MRPAEFVARWWKQLLTLAVLLAGLGVATWQVLESDKNQRLHARNLFRSEATEVADKLRRQVRTSVSSMYALASMIEVDGGKFLEQHFEPIAGTILQRYKGISNFDIAPFAVVMTKVPLKGNEGAIGHAMLSDHRRIEATLATIREGRALLDGPLKLLQGGTAVIARYPVFTAFSPKYIPDIYSWWPEWSHGCCETSMPLPGYGAESLPGPVDESGNQTYFYGLVEFVSKIEKLTEDLNLGAAAQKMSFQFRNKNPHPSMVDSPVFLTSPDITPETALDDPEVIPISLPDIRIEWEFLAVPAGGWPGPSVLNIVVLAGIYGVLMAAGFVYILVRRLLSMSASSKLLQEKLQKQREEIIQRASAAVEELAAPMVLISAEIFLELGRLMSFEELRNAGKVIMLDTLAQVQKFRESRWIIFFSHQWLSYSGPDKDNLHYSTMCGVLSSIIASLPAKGSPPDLSSAFIWVDFGSISQVNRSVQALCINSLPLFASEADAFVMTVPSTVHGSTNLPCNLETYSQRGWCRAEILCKVCASGMANMYIAQEKKALPKEHPETQEAFDLQPLSLQRFKELSISVFEGKFTCCALGHPNGSVCDKQKLMSPILGMYILLSENMEGTEGGEANDAKESAGAEVFEYLKEHQDHFFPHSTKYSTNGKEVTKELFGDVVRSSSFASTTAGALMSKRSSSGLHGGVSTSVTSAQLDLAIPVACPAARKKSRDAAAQSGRSGNKASI